MDSIADPLLEKGPHPSLINSHFHRNQITGLACDIFHNYSLATAAVVEVWAETRAMININSTHHLTSCPDPPWLTNSEVKLDHLPGPSNSKSMEASKTIP
jgi:hypothetical protein